ncbi:MAG: MFS transporter [Ignavibacteriae bacterium]|nr:MFS transporter [Ignavibacteriota bacterium]
MSIGYFLTSLATAYALVFMSLLFMTLGAGFFKPIISGTIARSTDEKNSSLGFGIYYWSINLGAFIFPLILVPILKNISWSLIFVMAAIGTGWLIFLNLFAYKEPEKPESSKKIIDALKGILLVLKDFRFIIMIVIYSGFWILYFQMFDTVLWYLKDYMDMTPVNNLVNSFLGLFINNPNLKFDAEHVTVINALTIIVLQLFVSNIVKNKKALPTMIAGITMGTIGMAMLAISTYAWVEDKKALYFGYSFLYGVIGSGIGGILGANLYVHFVDKLKAPSTLWLIFSCIGVATIIGLILYNKYLAPKKV